MWFALFTLPERRQRVSQNNKHHNEIVKASSDAFFYSMNQALKNSFYFFLIFLV